MAKFTNTADGARGIVTKDGNTVWIEPGQSVDVEDADEAKVPEGVEKGEAAAKRAAEAASEPAPEPDTKPRNQR